jgi:mercuric ion transport protein
VKGVVGSVVAAVAASTCCIGPVVFSLAGAGALSAASTRFEPYRPWFVAMTVVLLGLAFYAAYRPVRTEADCDDDACEPGSNRTARINVVSVNNFNKIVSGANIYIRTS